MPKIYDEIVRKLDNEKVKSISSADIYSKYGTLKDLGRPDASEKNALDRQFSSIRQSSLVEEKENPQLS